MAKSHVVSALVQKHARLKGELVYHQQAVERLKASLEATGESSKLFYPSYQLRLIKAIRPKHRSEHFNQGECSRLVLDVLREDGEPMTAKAITLEIVRVKGLDLRDFELVAMKHKVVNVLKGLARREWVVRVQSKCGTATWTSP